MNAWQSGPFILNVSSGDIKAFCMCGLSKTGPLCDGTHKITYIKPEVVKVTEDTRLRVCGCQKSKRLPYCDGSHNG